MNLTEQLQEYVRACFSGLWIHSHEPHEALSEITQLCQQEQWTLSTWNIATGFQCPQLEIDVPESDPLMVLKTSSQLAQPNGAALLVLENYHRFLGNPEILQTLQQQILAGRHSRVVLVILSPVVELPVEVEKLITVLEHPLPHRDQIAEIARTLTDSPEEFTEDPAQEVVLDAAQGLTRLEAENALSLSGIRTGGFDPSTLWEQKTQALKQTGLLTLSQNETGLDHLGGLEALKSFCVRSLQRAAHLPADRRPQGVLLLGVPGVGKSVFCRSLGSDTGRPTVMLELGALLGSLVGQSEQNLNQALATIDALGKRVVMIDELEKTLAGPHGSGRTDGGVTQRLLGRLLTWLSDRTNEAYVVCTANNVSQLTRAGRFDGTFFLDLPDAAQKPRIWSIYQTQFERDSTESLPDDTQWTGAEIRACCRLAALLDVSLVEAAEQIVPIAVTAGERIEQLRNWAGRRCLDAARPGLYQHNATAAKSRRHLSYDPSQN